MSEQDRVQKTSLKRPINDNKETWKAYWKAQGQDWRLEPEINEERQKYLGERCAITSNIEQGIYPFKDIKLSRADVEWLLTTHENGRGPVDWSDKNQRERIGLDLRGANLSDANLTFLPLARLYGGLTYLERRTKWTDREQRSKAALNLERANLRGTHLEGAYLSRVHMQNANCEEAHLERADLSRANLEGTSFRSSHLEGAYLRRSSFNSASHLSYTTLSSEEFGTILVSDINWGGVNLASLNWWQVKMLGDESRIKQWKKLDKKIKNYTTYLNENEKAVRANRQLAIALQEQGLNEDAARFAYRAQALQRTVLRLQRKFGQYLFSLFLDILAGFGYRPGRSVLWYLVMICGFAMAYYGFGHLPLFPDAFVFSLTSFHGRGFFPGLGNETPLHNPLVVLAAIEAVFGLIIEISFIATFTQRYFGK